MVKLIDQYKIIVSELVRLSKLEDPWNDPEAKIHFPRTISIGDGLQISVSEKIDKAIGAIARLKRSEASQIKAKYTENDWAKALRSAFGEPLSSLDLDAPIDENAKALKDAINHHIGQLSARQFQPITYIFAGSWLRVHVDEFVIGPVKIETRDAWLERELQAGKIPKTTYRRILQKWSGARVNKRKPSRQSMEEDDIINAIERWPHVISVTMSGMSNELMQDRAARAARLSLTATALMWNRPTKALQGLNLASDDLPARSVVLRYSPKLAMSASYSSKLFRFGYTVEPEHWADISKQFTPLIRQISEVATYIAEGTSASGRAEMLRQLDVALRWFYEACRANEDLIAVTHFASCLDTLAGGKGDNGILRLFETICGMNREAPIHTDGHKLSTLVRKIYGDARSQFLHGSTTGHLDDWSDLRMSAETLTRWALVACLFKADEDPTLLDFQ
ncbi:hypothetical protein QTA58_23475 [Neorhizobium sp. CSC1952]|uniref:hypothetical protein n=1 Tax=Neorhizobium sp. CSC1952 TaxID=2978974 RepID=UPI0025A50FA2|nr:hypothetical protein [Rhizobium sp. CSC1952]WJR67103.1 hypothetical protein QTA58_23475 [Rhizobium sp. CSC1952]